MTISISIRNFFLVALLATAVAGCSSGGGGDDEGTPGGGTTNPPPTGGGGGGGGGGTTNPPPVSDVSLEQLAGTWFGTFDDKTTVHTMSVTIDGGNITALSLDGNPTDLTGPVTKASEAPRIFRFTLQNQETPPRTISQGALLADPSATYLVFLDQFFGFGVIQKGATALPTYAQADIDQSWSGDAVTTASGFSTFARKSSSGTCTAVNATTSDCAITLEGGVSRAATQVTTDDPRGRWLGSYADTPQSGAPQNGTMRAYLSPDKLFAGGWACVDFDTGFPDTCDFAVWRRQ